MSNNKNLPAKTGNHLPSLQDLHHDVELAFKDDQLNLILNQEPPKNWIIQHPTIKKEVLGENGQKTKVPIEYIQVEKVEFMLTRIFQEWKVEILREGALFNSVYAAIRLHYKHPITGEWSYHDGLGAVGVQLDADRGEDKLWDLRYIKQDAVMKALPAAVSYAIKDAADHFGKLFGRDLNRANTIDFMTSFEKERTSAEPLTDEIKASIQLAEDPEFLNQLWTNNPQFQPNSEFMQLITARKAELKKPRS